MRRTFATILLDEGRHFDARRRATILAYDPDLTAALDYHRITVRRRT